MNVFCHPLGFLLRFFSMRIMSFNTWGGRVGESLTQFIAKHGEDTDLFCLQEIFKEASLDIVKNLTVHNGIQLDLFGELQKLLPNHQGFFCPFFEDAFGIAIFVKKDLAVLETGEETLYEGVHFLDAEHPDADCTRKMQWVRIKDGDRVVSVVNLHGHWVPGDKSDTKETLEQTKVILDTLAGIDGPKIICADLNLHPETESVRTIEGVFRNIGKEHDLTSTRTSLFPWPHRVVDYIFASRDLEVKDFQVLAEPAVSDHAAIVAEV
jgi:endonuclease/exonuclease/phosphatase family metal-dependent hydrolase